MGSNSIRLMISDGVNAQEKRLIVTRLAKGLAGCGKLSADAIADTKAAIKRLVEHAHSCGARQVYLFATEAIRSATNGAEFVQSVKDEMGYCIDVIEGNEEAEIGFLGAYTGSGSCAIVDIGGASTELVIGGERGIAAAASAKIGAMRLLDMGGENRDLCNAIIDDKIAVYNSDIKFDELIGIGGTATTLSAMAQELEVYDSAKVDGSILSLTKIEEMIERVKPMSLQSRRLIKGLMPQRAEVIVCGAYILTRIMKKLGVDKIKVSERDNLEGYLIKKLHKQ